MRVPYRACASGWSIWPPALFILGRRCASVSPPRASFERNTLTLCQFIPAQPPSHSRPTLIVTSLNPANAVAPGNPRRGMGA